MAYMFAPRKPWCCQQSYQMDQALSLDRLPHTSRHQEDSASVNSETVNQGEYTGPADLTPDQIDMILHPPIRSGLELDWPAGPRLATVELQPDDSQAVSFQNAGHFIGSHAIQLNADYSLLLSPQVPEVIQEQAGGETGMYQPQDVASSVLTPLTEIDEALMERAIRGLEVPSNSDNIIVVFADGTWVIIFVWLIGTTSSLVMTSTH